MVVVLWPLAVRKECGLGSDTIRGVCTPLRLVTVLPHSLCLFSDAASTTLTDGLSMRRA